MSVVILGNVLLHVLLIVTSVIPVPEHILFKLISYASICLIKWAANRAESQLCPLVCQCDSAETLWSGVWILSAPEAEMKISAIATADVKAELQLVEAMLSGKHRSLITEWHSDIK